MDLLDENLELLLKNLLENKKKNVSEFDCKRSEIDALIERGYFTKIDKKTMSGWEYAIEPTQKANYYFYNKNKYKKAVRQENIGKWVRFWIPTIISICALAVSIIALCKQN